MPGTVVSVNKMTALDNAAAVERKIKDLVEALYSGPEWVRQGPNFISNSQTGEVVNLNQAAVAILETEGPRNDAVAVVESEDGSRESVFIHEDAVKAAGNDMVTLGRNLQAVLSEGFTLSALPKWVYWAGGGVILLALLQRRGNSSPRPFRSRR